MPRYAPLTILLVAIALNAYTADIYGFRPPGYSYELVRQQVDYNPKHGGQEQLRIFRTVVLERTGDATVAPEEVPGLIRRYYQEAGFHVWPGDPQRDGKVLMKGHAGGGRRPVHVDEVSYHFMMAVHFRVSPSADQVTLVIESTRTLRRDGAAEELAGIDERLTKLAEGLGWEIGPSGLLAGGSPGSETWGESDAVLVHGRHLRPPRQPEEGCLFFGPSVGVEVVLFPTEDEAQAWLERYQRGVAARAQAILAEAAADDAAFLAEAEAAEGKDPPPDGKEPEIIPEQVHAPVVEIPALQPGIDLELQLQDPDLQRLRACRIGRHVVVPDPRLHGRTDGDLAEKLAALWEQAFPEKEAK